LQSFLRKLVKHHVYLGTALDRLAGCHVVPELLYRHKNSFFTMVDCNP
jgi:hypothetical protein